MRGHETFVERGKIVAENRANKARALLYLEWLATALENESGVDLASAPGIISTPQHVEG